MKRLLCPLLAAALLAAALPPAPARAGGDSSDGAAVSIGLVAAVVVVYGLVALRSDVENLASATPDASAIERAVAAAEESPLVLEAVAASSRLPSPAPSSELAGAALGWKFRF